MRKMSFAEFALYMKTAQARVVPEMEKVVFDVTASAVLKAESLIGRENFEWAPLSLSTLHGGRSPSGHYYPGKIWKNQVGRISDTDPLLGRGTMRDSIAGEVYGFVGIVGARDPKAVVHELGGHANGSAIPARPFLSLGLSLTIPEIEGHMTIAYTRIFAT